VKLERKFTGPPPQILLDLTLEMAGISTMIASPCLSSSIPARQEIGGRSGSTKTGTQSSVLGGTEH